MTRRALPLWLGAGLCLGGCNVVLGLGDYERTGAPAGGAGGEGAGEVAGNGGAGARPDTFEPIWVRNIGEGMATASSDQHANSVAVSAGAVLVAGSFQGGLGEELVAEGVDGFVVSYDPDGAPIPPATLVRVGTGIDSVEGIGVGTLGEWVAGYYLDMAATEEDAFVGLRGALPAIYGGVGRQLALDVAVEGGDAIIVGMFDNQLTLGATVLPGVGPADGFVAHFTDPAVAGQAIALGGPGDESIVAVATDGDSVAAVGSSTAPFNVGTSSVGNRGLYDALLVTGSIGALTPTTVRVVSFGGMGNDHAIAVALANDGDVVVVGRFEGDIRILGAPELSSQGEADAFVARIDPSGAARWARAFGGVGFDEARAVAVTADDEILVSGDFTLSADFGTGPLTAAGLTDMFLVRLDAGGSTLWSTQIGAANEDVASALALDETGRAFAVGGFHGNVLGVTSDGGADGLVLGF